MKTRDRALRTGLGLHITRILIEAMGGRVAIASPVGGGVCARLLFPVTASAGEFPTEVGAKNKH